MQDHKRSFSFPLDALNCRQLKRKSLASLPCVLLSSLKIWNTPQFRWVIFCQLDTVIITQYLGLFESVLNGLSLGIPYIYRGKSSNTCKNTHNAVQFPTLIMAVHLPNISPPNYILSLPQRCLIAPRVWQLCTAASNSSKSLYVNSQSALRSYRMRSAIKWK